MSVGFVGQVSVLVECCAMPMGRQANGENGGKHVLVWNQIDLEPEDRNASNKPTAPPGRLGYICTQLDFSGFQSLRTFINGVNQCLLLVNTLQLHVWCSYSRSFLNVRPRMGSVARRACDKITTISRCVSVSATPRRAVASLGASSIYIFPVIVCFLLYKYNKSVLT